MKAERNFDLFLQKTICTTVRTLLAAPYTGPIPTVEKAMRRVKAMRKMPPSYKQIIRQSLIRQLEVLHGND